MSLFHISFRNVAENVLLYRVEEHRARLTVNSQRGRATLQQIAVESNSLRVSVRLKVSVWVTLTLTYSKTDSESSLESVFESERVSV